MTSFAGMPIVIFSRGRYEFDYQKTLIQLAEKAAAVLPNVVLVVPQSEYAEYEKRVLSQIPVISLIGRPLHCKNISQTRHWWVYEGCQADMTLCLDDDLEFYVRRYPLEYEETTLVVPNNMQMIQMIDLMYSSLMEGWVHAGISHRQGNNHTGQYDYPWREITRACCVHALNTKIIKQEGCRYDRVAAMQDFDMTLQLLRKGYPNRVNTMYCFNQKSSAPGGASIYRTQEVKAEAAEALRALHPDFVSVVEKHTPSTWKNLGGVTTDVRIQWKKAYKSDIKGLPIDPTSTMGSRERS